MHVDTASPPLFVMIVLLLLLLLFVALGMYSFGGICPQMSRTDDEDVVMAAGNC